MAAERFYAVIFDAGSSSTRPFIYRIIRKEVDGAGNVVQPAQVVEVVKHNGESFDNSLRAQGGIQAQKTDAEVAAHLDPLFTAVTGVLALLPALPVKYYLYATGGVRDRLTHAEREALHRRLAKYIEQTRGIAKADYTYKPISGTEEARYGWVAANRSQSRPYDAGYVEMGGATAQIAFPLKAEDYAEAARVVEHVNLPTDEEMRKLYGNRPWGIPEVNNLRQGHLATLTEVVSLWAGVRKGNAEEVQRWVGDEQNLGDLAKLEGVVRLWGGDFANIQQMVGQLGSRIDGLSRLEQVRKQVEMSKKAKVEDVGPQRQKVFLASYPLGSDAGYKEYIKVLFDKGETYGLQGGVEDDRTIFFDPSKRDGYPSKVVGDRIIKFRADEAEEVSESNLAKTSCLVRDAYTKLFPGAAITRPLDSALRRVDFIGASNFWWTMCLALDSEGAFNLSTFQRSTKDSSKITHHKFRKIHANKPAWKLDIYDNSVFTATWTLCVLRQAFGLPLTKAWGDGGKDISFTPYNGGGADRNRFSWTLGTAVLLASPDLDDLAQSPIRAPAA